MAAARSTSARIPIPASANGYPGSKAASGLAERIIREMPPHAVYVEAFAGRAAVWRKKRPAASSILIDLDPKPCHWLRSYIAAANDAGDVEIICGNALQILPSLPAVQASDTLVYLDAPYLKEVRTKTELYDCEMTTTRAHASLLTMAAALPCLVMISHYDFPLYAKRLKRWRMVSIPAMTRGGPRIERVWCNFGLPKSLHDPRYVGANFRERERIKRKSKRWTAKFLGMDPRERQAIAAALIGVDRSSVEAAMRSAPPIPAIAAASVNSDDGRP